ncbi:hypothetical protein MATL_G00127030 [Megalops atlanticus]|uniref:C-X-C chemokine receptor type 3 n=1 Tax=Megalops atlanticus TaxID=7932 RepID=A0A9D3T4C4_MEGAT|nr:hypothetical protein MATL_G00127030 [Megalops atlanticus]
MNTVRPMEVDLDGLFVHNTTYDYENYETTEDECTASNHLRFEAVLIPILYSLALVLGLLGNGLVLAVLCRLQRSWSVTDTFILHLTLADTVLLLTLPFWAVEAAQGWSFGGPSCKLMGAIFQINFYCGIFLLACISLDRYLSIVHAVQMYSRCKPWVVQASCLCVWLFCLLLSIPDLVLLEPIEEARRGGKTVCSHNYLKFDTSAKDWRMASRLVYHIVGFILPALVMVFCYSCILLRLNRGSQGPQKQKAIRVILVLVVVFFVSWTPFNITLIADTFHSEGDVSGACKSRAALDVALVVTTALACVHSCLNPALYSCLCINFRRHLLDMLGWRSQARADHELSLWDQPENSALRHSEEMGQLNPPKSTEQTQLSLIEQKSTNGISS